MRKASWIPKAISQKHRADARCSIAIRAPLLQKIFADVHGVARWEDDHLTLGSLRLIDGLTIDSLMFDLSRLAAARLGTELSVSAFGGHIRANVTTERNEKARIWELAGTASGISLSNLATALGATEPVHGSVRASKFTFRGDPRDVLHATASIWTELIDFSWRERRADGRPYSPFREVQSRDLPNPWASSLQWKLRQAASATPRRRMGWTM